MWLRVRRPRGKALGNASVGLVKIGQMERERKKDTYVDINFFQSLLRSQSIPSRCFPGCLLLLLPPPAESTCPAWVQVGSMSTLLPESWNLIFQNVKGNAVVSGTPLTDDQITFKHKWIYSWKKMQFPGSAGGSDQPSSWKTGHLLMSICRKSEDSQLLKILEMQGSLGKKLPKLISQHFISDSSLYSLFRSMYFIWVWGEIINLILQVNTYGIRGTE